MPTTKESQNQTPEAELNKLIEGYVENPVFDQSENNVEANDLLNQGQKRKYTKRKKLAPEAQSIVNPVKLSGDTVLSGALLLMLIDIALPNIMCMVNNKMSKKKVNPKALQMSKSQMDELSPIADKVTEQLLLKGNPVSVLIISLISIYGLNLIQEKV
jgi:hypothetical protein